MTCRNANPLLPTLNSLQMSINNGYDTNFLRCDIGNVFVPISPLQVKKVEFSFDFSDDSSDYSSDFSSNTFISGSCDF
ncbi:hypothetical protein KM1_059370 [Entamoeba histolytica HM-3:IMSS]|uniref:Uncharacterized protein n=3 Tax=Entamoeba TaxID=5758 RepID=A0A175JU67_ENTHI|nr:hypothetical protein KM1_059370 [Entamoeba histolytica HM-3:IMSS]GAT97309.1 hypothetical protein CL6EHI_c00164 [Entamoeba histolytica]